MSVSKTSSKSLLENGDLSTGASENGKEKDKSSSGCPERPTSPEVAKCAICLGDVINRSCSNSCAHQFCFGCLLEWSKVKPECPLCKCSFRAIYHNFRSNDEFDEYVVPTQPVPHLSIRFTASGANYRLSPFFRVLEARSAHPHSPHPYEAVSIPAMFQAPAPPPASNPFNNGSSGLRPEYFGDLISDHRRVQEEAVQMPGYQNRRRRYDRNEWVQPFGSTLQPGSVICPSVEYIRHHPSAISRLRNWLYRELTVLLGLYRSRDQMAFVYDLIMHLINHYDVRSRDFRDMVNTYFGTKTAHFQHELYHFILSGMSMEEYDRVAEYPSTSGSRNAARRNAPPEVITLDSDDERAEFRSVRHSRDRGAPPQNSEDVILLETSSDEEVETFPTRLRRRADVNQHLNRCSIINCASRGHQNSTSLQEAAIHMPDLSVGMIDVGDEREGSHRRTGGRVRSRDPEMPVLEPQVYPGRSADSFAANDSGSIIDHSRATAATTTVTTSSRSVPALLSAESVNQNLTRPSVLSSSNGMLQHNEDMVRLVEPEFDIDLNVSVESYSSPPRQSSRPLTSPDFPILQLRRNIADRGRGLLFDRRSRTAATGSNSGVCPFSTFGSSNSGPSSSRGIESISAFVPYEPETSHTFREELARPPRPSCIHGTGSGNSHNLASSVSSTEYHPISPTPTFRIDLYPHGMSSSQVMDLSRSAGLISNSLSNRTTPRRSPATGLAFSPESPPPPSILPPPAIASSSMSASHCLVGVSSRVGQRVSTTGDDQQSDTDELECLGSFPIEKKPPLAVITLSSDDEEEERVKTENKHERLNLLSSDDDTNLLDGFLNWAAHPLASDFNLLDVPSSPPVIDFHSSSSSSSSNLLPVVPQQQTSTVPKSGRTRAGTSSGSSAVISIPTIPSFRLTIKNNSVQNISESSGTASSKQPVASSSGTSDRHRKKHKHSSPKKNKRRFRIFSSSEDSDDNNDQQSPKSVQNSATVSLLKIPKKRKYTTTQEDPDNPSFSTSDSSVDSEISSISDDEHDSDYVVFDYAKSKTKTKKKSSPKKKHKSKTKKAKKTKKSKDKDKEKSRDKDKEKSKKSKKKTESEVKASSSDANNTAIVVDMLTASSSGTSSRHSHKRVKKSVNFADCASGASPKSTVQAPITTSSSASISFSTPIMNMPICDFEYPSGLLDLSFNNRTEHDDTPLLPIVDDENTIDIRTPPPPTPTIIEPSLSSTVDTSAIFGSPSRAIFNAFWDDFASVADRRNTGWND